MTDLPVTDVTVGGLALAGAVLYAAWHEYAAKNQLAATIARVAPAAPAIPNPPAARPRDFEDLDFHGSQGYPRSRKKSWLSEIFD